jgi:peptide chain release factor 2
VVESAAIAAGDAREKAPGTYVGQRRRSGPPQRRHFRLLRPGREGENVDADLRREIDSLRELLDKLETETLLSGENDARNAIVTIHPGAGGTESQDWADMLLRMYLRWAERQGFETVLYDYQPGEEAGLKSATFASTVSTPSAF